MKNQCIRCRGVWGEGDPETEGYSHGLCPDCLRDTLAPLYRKRQLAEGNFDCFAKSSGFCDQVKCKYREVCLKPRPPMETGPDLNELPAGYVRQVRHVNYNEGQIPADFS